MDDSPIQHDYQNRDLACKNSNSYRSLNVFNTTDIDVLKKANSKMGEGYKGKINKKDFDEAWEDIIDFRRALEALDKFDVICDVPEDVKFNANTAFLYYKPLKELSKVYGRYFLLKVSDRKAKEAVVPFCRLHNVARKGMKNSTFFINKMIFTSIVEITIDIAYAALSSEKCDTKTLEHLKQYFKSLDSTELSMERSIIAEYLVLKNTMHEQLSPETFMDSAIIPSFTPGKQISLHPLFSSLVYHLGFKPNRSLNEMKTYYALLIDAQNKYPVDTTKVKQYFEAYGKKPPIRNMIGWILNSIAMPDITTYSTRFAKIKVQSDLLSLLISQKLGEPVMIKDLYTGQNLTYKKQGYVIRHTGADGKFETEDDIILGENPLF